MIENDLVENTIYSRVLDSGYAARASDLLSFRQINADVAARWLYPLVPDAERHRNNVYRGRDAVLKRCETASYLFVSRFLLSGLCLLY